MLYALYNIYDNIICNVNITVFKKVISKCWGDGSAVKTACCSCEESRCNFELLYGIFELLITPHLKEPMFSSFLQEFQHAHGTRISC